MNKFIRHILKTIIGFCIQFIEFIEYRKYDIDENDITKKIIETYETPDLFVKTDSGFQQVSHIHITQPYRVYEIETNSGRRLECADNHIIFDKFFNQVFVKDLKKNDEILTEDGTEKIISIHKYPFKISMVDLTIEHPDHRYYINGILSHNTTTISAFLSWMLVFHSDKNILIAANKEKTAIEIVDKVLKIFKGLPFWLKPGTKSWGKTSIELDNGSKLLSTATTNTASIGFTIHCVLLDEFAHIPANIVNNFWRSVYPTLSSSKISQCIITSTPNGTTNKFYELWSGAMDGTNTFYPIRVDYWEVPGHDDAWAAKERANFGDEEFAQEYELQFNKNSKMLMKAKDMDFLSSFETTYVQKEVYVANQYANDEHITWHPDFDPNNINENDRFVFLVDLSEGNGDPDEMQQVKEKTPDANTINIFKLVLNSQANLRRFSNISCSIKDCVRFVQIGKYQCSSEDEIYTARVCSALAYNLFKDHERNNVRIGLEMNFNGKSFYEEFRRHQFFTDSTILKTYHKKPIPGEKQKKKPGFKTTANKEKYCVKGNKLISMRRIIVNCSETFRQMKSFGYVRGKLKGIACHDDLSMPVFNHIPRMLDEANFISWIEEYIYFNADRNKVYYLNEIIQKWAMENPEMSDGDFADLYGVENGSSIITDGDYVDFSHVTYGTGFSYPQQNNFDQNISYASLLNR